MTKFKQWQRFQLVTLMTIFVCQFGLSKQQQGCQPLSVRMCQDNVLPYNFTVLPNMMGHSDIESVRWALHEFIPLVKIGCSPHLASFLCVSFLPPCTIASGLVVKPCRSLCEEARRGCQSVMMRFGFQWPEYLQCERFPDTEPCISGTEVGVVSTTAKPEKTSPNIVEKPSESTGSEWLAGPEERASAHCEPITVPMCKNVTAYNFTMFPNALRHRRQNDAAMEVHQFFPLVKSGCSRHLAPFLCTAYLPPCMSSPGLLVGPCRSLCEEARKGCQPLMNKYGFSWPHELRCELFSDSQPCIGGVEENAASTTSTKRDTTSPKLVQSSPGVPAETAAPPSSTPPSVSVGPSGVSVSSLTSGAVVKRLQSSLLDWLVTGTSLNKAQTELAAEQVLVAKLTRKKLALDYGLLKRQSGGSGSRSGIKKRRNRRKINQ